MKRCNRMLSLLLIVLVLLCAAGASVAEAFYKWVPEEYSEPCMVSNAEYLTLSMTAHHNFASYLTDNLIKTSLQALALKDTLRIRVDTRCQPTWDTYIGNGRFSVSDRELRATYGEAGNEVMKIVELYFPDVDRERVVIHFDVQGLRVGIWRNGVMKLQGE